MTKTFEHIRRIYLTIIVGLFSICNLHAQTASDSIPSRTGNVLMDVFDTDDVEEALPQYQEEADSLAAIYNDSIAALYARELLMDFDEEYRIDTYFERFNPTPVKAVWMAALVPGGGQIYNRKYWKLPIVYGGFLGLIYGYNWNQRYYKTYQNAYRDLMTGSPNASYLQFIRGASSLEEKRKWAKDNQNYLESAFTRKRNTYRNWRDYCVVGMLGVYLVSIVDAYVDAALYHFDVSPELDACNNPAMVVSYKIDF